MLGSCVERLLNISTHERNTRHNGKEDCTAQQTVLNSRSTVGRRDKFFHQFRHRMKTLVFRHNKLHLTYYKVAYPLYGRGA